MLTVTFLLGLALAATAKPMDVSVQDQAARIGSAGVTYVNLKGVLTPIEDSDASVHAFRFRTEKENPEDHMVTFKCTPLPDVYVSVENSRKEALFCHGYIPVLGAEEEKKVVFLFAAQGFDFSHEEKEVKLVLGRSVVSGLTDTMLGVTVLGHRVKRQWGGFSGSGAVASASSFGVGGGYGGYPGGYGRYPGGYGGAFSGSHAQAAASSGAGVGGYYG